MNNGHFSRLFYGEKVFDSRFSFASENAIDLEDQIRNGKRLIQHTLNVIPNFMSITLGGEVEPSKQLIGEVAYCLAELADLEKALDRLEEEARCKLSN